MKFKDIHIRGPFILPENNTYYLYGTRGKTAWTKGYGLDVYTSKDLENWSSSIECFTLPKDFWADGEIWAPEVHKYKGIYYMFVTFYSDKRNRATQILKSDSPLGPFLPFTDDAITPLGWRCLDGTFYISKDNKPYIVFCHEWQQVKDGEICAMELTEDLTAAAGEPIILFKGSYPDWADKGREDYVTDGPFFYRTKSGSLLMIWSTFKNHEYLQAVSRSDNGEITGNWIHQDILFEKDGGHGMIFTDFNGIKHLIIHSPNRHPKERPVLFTIDEQNDKLIIK